LADQVAKTEEKYYKLLQRIREGELHAAKCFRKVTESEAPVYLLSGFSPDVVRWVTVFQELLVSRLSSLEAYEAGLETKKGNSHSSGGIHR